jgi:hypothetical protein
MTRFTLLAACAILSACTTFKLNSDDTTTIEHQGGVAEAQDLANRACRRVGGQNQVAEVISTVNKNPDLPPGSGTQLSTFRCSASARP